MSGRKALTEHLEYILEGCTRWTGGDPYSSRQRRQCAFSIRVKEPLCTQPALQLFQSTRHVSSTISAHGSDNETETPLRGVHIHTPGKNNRVSDPWMKAHARIAAPEHCAVDDRILVFDREVPMS